jgi:apolipoprotein N-acyltransferase
MSQSFLVRLGGLRGRRVWLAAALLGVLAGAALPPLFVLPVLLVAVPGLLTLIGAARTGREAFMAGFWFGFGLHLVGLYWITEAILIEAARYWWFVPIAVPGLSAILALFIAVPCVAARWAPAGWPRVLVLAGAWVLGDLARQFVATGFPWNLWGSVWEFPGRLGDIFIQPAAIVSVHGLTLFTLLLAALPVLGRRAWLAGAVGVLAWAGFGLWRLQTPAPPAPGVKVVLVQGNVAQGMKWNRDIAIETFRHHLELTAEGVARAGAGKVVVAWPETSSTFLLQTDEAARQAIVAATRGNPALIGSVRFDDTGQPRNSLIAIKGDSSIADFYDKWHLVPGGEYKPSWVPLPVQIVPGGGLAFGSGPRTLRVPGLPAFGPLICYEAIFPGQVLDEADRPDWMVNITNDAWFGNSTGPRQHLAAARMRAVEEGLPLVRAANTGISAAFDAFGHEEARLEVGQSGTLVIDLPGKLPRTLFARFGLIIPLTFAIASIVAGMVGARLKKRRVDF